MGIIQINMSSSCLKLLLALTLFVIITECRPNRRSRKECKDDDDCSPGFSCIQTRKKGNVCAKARPEAAKPNPETDVEEGENHNADATNGDEDDGDALVDETDNTEDDENDEDDGTDYPDGENPSDEPDDTEVTEDDDADYPEDEGIDVPFDESDEGDENN